MLTVIRHENEENFPVSQRSLPAWGDVGNSGPGRAARRSKGVTRIGARSGAIDAGSRFAADAGAFRGRPGDAGSARQRRARRAATGKSSASPVRHAQTKAETRAA